MTTISAKVIAKSRNIADPDPNRFLGTILCRYPRPIHSELLTHRVFSKNSASSRAIPVQKMIQSILDDPFVPLIWGKNQKGMQHSEECNEKVRGLDGLYIDREDAWLELMHRAIYVAQNFSEAGYHKQIVNRLLEPFMHITVLISSTEWDNFYKLRDHKDAEPHIQILAQVIRKAFDGYLATELKPGQWHLPFVRITDEVGIIDQLDQLSGEALGNAVKLSAARCASTSYETVEGEPMTLERANNIFRKLVEQEPIHASPFEHVAQADDVHLDDFGPAVWKNRKMHRNFVGWKQYRAIIGA